RRGGVRLLGQPHLEFVASMKLLTELTTPAAAAATGANCLAVGLDGSAWTALCSVSTEVVMASVWLGKSLFAELTTVLASLWTVSSCVFRPLTPLLAVRLVRPLTEL